MNRREFVSVLAALPFAQNGSGEVRLKILGTAQDGGFPQVGTYDPRNDNARQNPKLQRMVASMAILNSTSSRCYIVDATPHLPAQLDVLRAVPFLRSRPSRALIDGILLTHAHMGHYTGLMYLGLEGMDARKVPVHCTERMAEYLSSNGPWNLLTKRNEIELQPFRPGGDPVRLDAQVSFRSIAVPHRDEYSDTVGFIISGPQRSVFYLPDLDRWTPECTEVVSQVDFAFIDGTFFDDNEMPGVDMTRFPHPRIIRTMDELRAYRSRVYFTHLNNSNPALDPTSVARRRIADSGFKVAEDGLELRL